MDSTREKLRQGQITLCVVLTPPEKKVVDEAISTLPSELSAWKDLFASLFKTKIREATASSTPSPSPLLDVQAIEKERQGIESLFASKGITGVKPRTIHHVMIYQGLRYWQEFFEHKDYIPWKKYSGTVKTVMGNNRDPRAFLTKAHRKIEEILAMPEFTEFKEDYMRKLLIRLVTHTSTDPIERLRLLKNEADEANLINLSDRYRFFVQKIFGIKT